MSMASCPAEANRQIRNSRKRGEFGARAGVAGSAMLLFMTALKKQISGDAISVDPTGERGVSWPLARGSTRLPERTRALTVDGIPESSRKTRSQQEKGG